MLYAKVIYEIMQRPEDEIRRMIMTCGHKDNDATSRHKYDDCDIDMVKTVIIGN